MKTLEQARELASRLVSVGNRLGVKTSALVTDMNQPLASAAGNALEVANAADFLTMSAPDERLWKVTVSLGGEALAIAGLAESFEDGCEKMASAYRSGKAAEIFDRMVAALGGPVGFLGSYKTHLPTAPVIRDLTAERACFVSGWNAKAVGLAVVELGGGRVRAADPIDYAVGLDQIAEIGTKLDAGTPVLRIHARSEDDANRAEARLRTALAVAQTAPERPVLLKQRIA